jgi:SAM-dependent methyltransferase
MLRHVDDPTPLDPLTPRSLFGGLTDDQWRWLHLEGRVSCPFLTRYLPSLPDQRLQDRLTATSGDTALEWGGHAYELFKQLYEKHAGPLSPTSRVLDFGCGWGRVIRFFLRDVEPTNLVGIDVSEEAIAACLETNHWCRFERCGTLPPTALESQSFDLAYAYSVFSHLSEEAHLRWLVEFERLLKPEGLLIVTTLPRAFLAVCSEWAAEDDDQDRPAWQRQAIACLTPIEHFLSAYDRGEFCYAPLSEDRPHFGLASISEQYVRSTWIRHLEVLEFIPARDLSSPGFRQDVIVCRNRRCPAARLPERASGPHA